MFLRRSLLFAAPLLLAGTLAFGQQAFLPTTSKPSWNTYVPSVIPNNWSSIIGAGGTRINTSQNHTANSTAGRMFAVPLPFDFIFLNQKYSTGFNVLISTFGYMSFSNTAGATAAGVTDSYGYYSYYLWQTLYYNYTFMGFHSKVIMPYKGWLATSVSTGDGGIYTMTQGSAPNRVWVIEWRAQTGYTSYGSTTGNFQARLYEATGNIEFQYGPTSINGYYYLYGSYLAGLKNLEEGYYIYTPLPSSTEVRHRPEAERYYLFNNPGYGQGDTVAITGMRIRNLGTQGQLEYYPYSTTTAPNPAQSPYAWHFGFPTSTSGSQVGYRLSPVLNDTKADSVWVTPVVAANAYRPKSNISLNAKFSNQGGNSRQDVPVRADIYRNGVKITSLSATAFPSSTAQFGTSTITFAAPVGSPITDTTGVFEARVYTQLSIDQDVVNDTARTTFYVSKDNDIAPFAIQLPLSNVAPLFQKHPVGVGVPIEVRFLNIGLVRQTDPMKVGYTIYDAGGNVMKKDSGFVTPPWEPISFRDVTFANWTPTAPGDYLVKAYTIRPNDEQVNNDTLPAGPSLGKPFSVRYEIEVSGLTPGPTPYSPDQTAIYPIGKKIPVFATFGNSGVSDATNIPVRLQMRNSAGTIVYDRTSTVLGISADNGQTVQRFVDFVPQTAGTYCVTAFSEYAQEPVRNNDTVKWCFNVKPALSGTIRIGFSERFSTIGEAVDSLITYGVAGPVTFELVDDSYTIEQDETNLAAIDLRGSIVGVGPNARVTWRPIAGKSLVTVNIRSASGIGFYFGQVDTTSLGFLDPVRRPVGPNPSGYMTFDGGPSKALKFTFTNTNTISTQPAFQRAIPFLFGQGASNYSIINTKIEPAVTGGGKSTFVTIPMVRYITSFNEFQFPQDMIMAVSSGIMLRNSAPIDPVIGRNWNNRDTLRVQNNMFDRNEIRGFGYGILSEGAGPLFVVAKGQYVDYYNQSNTYSNNLIEDVGRGGIVMLYEKNSAITSNTIRRVNNTSTTVGDAAGIWATAGANAGATAPPNRGNSIGLDIQKNRVSQVNAASGTGAAIWLETSENVFVTPANVVYRFPAAGATNHRVWNNMAWNYSGATTTVGTGLTVEPATRIDFVSTGNKVENNTFYNQIAGASKEYGVFVQRAGTSVRNNLFALRSQTTDLTALVINAPSYKTTEVSDYNAFDVQPKGYVGALSNVATNGFNLPSPPRAKTLNQWRALTGLDMNSVEGSVSSEMVSTTPGSEDLHIKSNLLGSIVGNRGAVVSGMSSDIDNDPRGASSVAGRYDIGADEFTGQIRNFDLQAEDVIAPAGYRATTGKYSDAEYVMTDSAVSVRTMVRNVGGQPMTNRSVTVTVGWVNPTNPAQVQQVTSQTKMTNVDVAQASTMDFLTFQPKSLRELSVVDGFYGANPNVTPIYRIAVTTGIDDNGANNTYTKDVRFYVQRSGREAMVAVESYQASMVGASATVLSNKLNSDTLVAALAKMGWERADGVGREDYDLFERDKWPLQNLNYTPWTTMIWEQGSEAQGLESEERAALKAMLGLGSMNYRNTMVMAGQDVARIHDVALTATNGATSDPDFVRNYLRAEYRGNTSPAAYIGRIRGVAVNPEKIEQIAKTLVATDAVPVPGVLRTTAGEGIARASHVYVDQGAGLDSLAGVASSALNRNVVYYAIDWRHAGRYAFEPDRSGAYRLLLGALDFSETFKGVLPVKLVSFEAYQSGETAVTVDWKTASELDVAGMQIERAAVSASEAGETVGSFDVVDRVSPRGSVSTGASYRTIDGAIESGREYAYRLVTTNSEGVRTIEAERRVKTAGVSTAGMTLAVLPNPVSVSGSVSYQVPSDMKARVVLYDELGRQVRVLESEVTGSGVIRLDVGSLVSGSYTVRLETPRATMSRSLTVSK